MSDLARYVLDIELRRLPELRRQLTPLISGKLHIGKKAADSDEWSDITPQHIKLLEDAIGTYEAIITKLRLEKLAAT